MPDPTVHPRVAELAREAQPYLKSPDPAALFFEDLLQEPGDVIAVTVAQVVDAWLDRLPADVPQVVRDWFRATNGLLFSPNGVAVGVAWSPRYRRIVLRLDWCAEEEVTLLAFTVADPADALERIGFFSACTERDLARIGRGVRYTLELASQRADAAETN
jgi:hypothetical protein